MSKIKSDEHVFVVGMTGSGKSFFCETFLKNEKYVVKLDTKREFEERKKKGLSPWFGLKENIDFTIVEHLEDIYEVETDKIIYSPSFEELNENFYDEFFKFCFERENNIIWVDELMSITTTQKIPNQLKRVITQGRSKNVGVWCCTQRPSGVPQIIPANCTHIIAYEVRLKVDKQRLVDISGCPEFFETLDKYVFLYYKAGNQKAYKMKINKGGV